MGVRVHQEDEDKLKATVAQKEKDRTVTGTVTASYNPETDDNTLPTGEVRETPNALLYAYDDNAGAWKRVYIKSVTDGIYVWPKQDTAANLKAEVTQAAKDRTVTNATASNLKSEVTPSGDMARKDPWDRNADNITSYFGGNIGAGAGWTIQLTYTVPANHKAYMTLVFLSIFTAVATAGRTPSCRIDIQPSGGTARTAVRITHYLTTVPVAEQTWTALAFLLEGDALVFRTENDDTIAHYMSIGNSGKLEFDE